MFEIVLLLIDAALWSLIRWSRAHPEHPVARVLWSEHGPRTDVRYMTRAQLFGSARIFLLWSTLFLGGHVAFLFFAGNALFDSILLASLWGAVMFSGFIALGGGFYLLLRAFLRSPSYVPPPIPSGHEFPPIHAA